MRANGLKSMASSPPIRPKNALPWLYLESRFQHNGVTAWVFRGTAEVPLPVSSHKQAFYRQEATLDDWDNLLLLWDDHGGLLQEPMRLVRPLGGDNHRHNLKIEWSGPLTRTMATMPVRDLDELQPEFVSTIMGMTTAK